MKYIYIKDFIAINKHTSRAKNVIYEGFGNMYLHRSNHKEVVRKET